MKESIIDKVNKYYSEKVIIHGATPQGVDWNGIESQENRFKQLIKVAEDEAENKYTILDYGCGYGSLYNYLKKINKVVNYIGYDISKEMLNKAREENDYEATWVNSINEDIKVDYVIASGLFNVKLNISNGEWENYIKNILDNLNHISIKGFSFNILTLYSDKENLKDYLYYASPEHYFGLCKKQYSKQVSLLHDYGLYEFTILVKK